MRIDRTYAAMANMTGDDARAAIADMTPEERRAFDDATCAAMLEWSDDEERAGKIAFARGIKRAAGQFRQ